MAKRFTDTKKWDHAWFQELLPRQKILWAYLCDTCDGVGIWQVNFKLAAFIIGEEVGWKDIEAIGLGSRIVKISNDKIWIPGFIKFQYKTLNPKNNAHRGMMKSILNSVQGLPLRGESKELVELFRKLLGDPQPTLGGESTDSTGKGKGRGKGKGKGKGKERGGAGEKKLPELAVVWNEHCGDLPKVIASNSSRNARINARLAEEPSLDVWTTVIQKIAASEFCNGRGNNKTGWIADFDWLLQPEVRLKVLEGKYQNRNSPKLDDLFSKIDFTGHEAP